MPIKFTSETWELGTSDYRQRHFNARLERTWHGVENFGLLLVTVLRCETWHSRVSTTGGSALM